MMLFSLPIIVISADLKLSNLCLSHFLSAKVSPEWRMNVGYPEIVSDPFSLNRGVP